MALDTIGTALVRRHIGRRLTALRERSGLTQEQAAAALDKGRSTIVRMEDGADGVRFREIDVKAMLEVYGAATEERDILLALTAETRNGRKKGWWHDYTDTALPEWFTLYVILEDSATAIRQYESELVPGLLQTAEYAEHLARIPAGYVASDDIARRVQVRMERQSLLSKPNPPKLDVVLNEAVIRRQVGSPEMFARQLRQLSTAAQRRTISIRILPWSAGMHGGMAASSFIMMDFPAGPHGAPLEPSLAYVETLTGAMYLNKPDEFAAYELVWRDLRKRALSPADSIQLINSILEGLPR
ncbi:helix-turn-helix domain-containing protein [Nocardia jejuensis]|uniref:helix-turn-helix domain-containing protein n=1 Tax=Nocardia jejuensis TaxID=328049 RepID=UPI00082B460B|nr:helix-turn-helix transcriptional regulator [Nocardia jejuensis]